MKQAMQQLLRDQRKTKIVATIGPSSDSVEMLARLVTSGVDVFRLNFSHGENSAKKVLVSEIRALSARMGKDIAILGDLQGPKIRTGRMTDGAVSLAKGTEVVITTDEVLGTHCCIPTIYRNLPTDVRCGSRILLDDGLLELRVIAVEGDNVRCQVVTGGILRNNKGINLPGVKVSAPSLTEKDIVDLEFCIEQKFDYIALSFVRCAEDVEGIKEHIRSRNSNIPVVAKIEKPEALRNFNKILKVTDAVMVARGDLGVEIQPEKVPIYQKKIIRACAEAGKPVITATQMLDSMIKNPRPTRAETSDVANAILDGTDAVMLSGETASGEYPEEAVDTMAKIAIDVESSGFLKRIQPENQSTPSVARAVAEAACHAAEILDARAVALFTQSGSTAALVSKFRPRLPVIAFTASPEIRRRLALRWGVKSLATGIMENSDQQINEVERQLLSYGFKKGDIIVIIMGTPIEAKGSTNLMKIHKLGTGGFFEIF